MKKVDINPLIEIIATLRDTEYGCPWDKAQTYESLVKYTLEETHELFDAIARDDKQNICEELGDLLFHLAFYARLAEEDGDFVMQGVIDAIVEKMRRRHPHIFSGEVYANETEQKADWEKIKAKERAQQSPIYSQLDAKHQIGRLPTVMQSIEMQKTLSKMGFDWINAYSVFDKIVEETDELKEALKQDDNQEHITEEYGDLLFALLNLGRKLDIDPEIALRKANHKFYTRSESMIRRAGGIVNFIAASRHEKEILWEQVKKYG
ncbi:MAG: nucleoside triphosphate pyrophosphohydrolase [Ostreibacterium sp.]